MPEILFVNIASIIEDSEFEERLPFEKSGNPVMSQVSCPFIKIYYIP